ncbi:MAG: hypothetical protein WCF57_18285 [Pyrinomonadaceae bacterium]
MKKSDRKLLAETLDRALDPPTQRRKPALASQLSEYDVDQAASSKEVTPPHPPSRGVTPPNPTRPIAPERDFNKRANSLDRLALPAGLFPGSSQKLYNALYVRTRGAVVPVKQIRATKRELSDWSGIRNVKTIDTHLRYFGAIGLIVSKWERGQNDGALYEVRLPEETTGLSITGGASHGVTPPDPTIHHDTPRDGGLQQFSELPHHQNSGSPHLTQVSGNPTTYSDGKTSFKTSTERDDDDAALAGLYAVLKEAATEVTGKGLSPSDRDRWRELGEVLATELKIAATRTTVSSAPSFLTEHLRRRLWKKDKSQLQAEAAAASRATPKPTFSVEQIAKCPDCGGSGFFYPQGYEGGVAKCKHEKLEATQSPKEQPPN